MFIRGRKLNISLVFITQSYFKVPKDVRLNTTHFFIAKIPNKRELQQIAINHSSDINTKDFANIYRKYTPEPYSFLINDTSVPSNNPSKGLEKIFLIYIIYTGKYAAHGFAKVSALKAFNAAEKFDFTCLSESYLYSTVSSGDSGFPLYCYNLIRAVYPKNIKQRGVCFYYGETLTVKTIQRNYQSEWPVCEVKFENKSNFIVTLYRSPSQNDVEFFEFLRGLESAIDKINQSNPYFVLL